MNGWLRFVSIWNRSWSRESPARPGLGPGWDCCPPTFRIETPSALIVMSDRPSLLSSPLLTDNNHRGTSDEYQHQVQISVSTWQYFSNSTSQHPATTQQPPNAGWENETCTKIDLGTTRDIWLKKLQTSVLTFPLGCNNM